MWLCEAASGEYDEAASDGERADSYEDDRKAPEEHGPIRFSGLPDGYIPYVPLHSGDPDYQRDCRGRGGEYCRPSGS